MDSKTIQNTKLKTWYLVSTPFNTVEIAKTMDAAPRRPAHDTTPISLKEVRKGNSSTPETISLANSVKKIITASAGRSTVGSCTGVTNSPNRKNMITCATLVSTSKNAQNIFSAAGSCFQSKYRINKRLNICCRSKQPAEHTIQSSHHTEIRFCFAEKQEDFCLTAKKPLYR